MNLHKVIHNTFHPANRVNRPTSLITNNETAIIRLSNIHEFICIRFFKLRRAVVFTKSNPGFAIIFLNLNRWIGLEETCIKVGSNANYVAAAVICQIRSTNPFISSILTSIEHWKLKKLQIFIINPTINARRVSDTISIPINHSVNNWPVMRSVR